MTSPHTFGSGSAQESPARNGADAPAVTEERQRVAAPSRSPIFREPATFVMWCRHRHCWGSYGEAETGPGYKRKPFPDKPRCPRSTCRFGWLTMEVYVGPNRPQIVETSV